MANFSITVQNAINTFGPAPSDKWGTGVYNFTWGSSRWGEGTEDLIISFEKFLSSTIDSDSSISNAQNWFANLSGSIDLDFETSDETLSDGSGYDFVFPKPTTNADDRALSAYTQVSGAASTWASATTQSTTWS